MRVSWQSAIVLALGLVVPGVANAQWGGIGSYSPPKTSRNPAVSPYLNLNRGGDPANNYYNLVRPQIDTNRSFQEIQQGTFVDPRLGPAQQGVGPDGSPLIGTQNLLPNQAAGLNTGHPAQFFYYSHYYRFPNRSGGGASSGQGSFGRPSNTQATPFFAGTGGILMPINPAGANPLGGGLFGGNTQYSAPGTVVMP